MTRLAVYPNDFDDFLNGLGWGISGGLNGSSRHPTVDGNSSCLGLHLGLGVFVTS